MSQQIINGDSAEVLKTIDSNIIDAVITDPPYGIEFLGKDWDLNTGAVEIWQECLRVLKPGGYLLAFSAARTYHQLATNIESAGFEIRDQIMWLYASGFPKAQDIGKAIDKRQGKKDPNFKGTETFNLTFGENPGQRLCAVCKKDQTAVYKCDRKDCGQRYQTQTPEAQQWHGWKTALKPAHEPICMARKPFKGSTMDNVLTHGVGALNIDATRVPWGKDDNPEAYVEWMKKYPNSTGSKAVFNNAHADAKGVGYVKDKDADINKDRDVDNRLQGRYPSNVLGEIADYQKYFYCPKVSRRERHRGFDNADSVKSMLDDMGAAYADKHGNPVAYEDRHNKPHILIPGTGLIYTHGLKHEYEQWCKKKNKTKATGNNHPTVKPVELMKYLVRLVTAAGSHILDPFAGSGSTGMACRELGRQFTGIDLDAGYCDIARRRIGATHEDKAATLFE